jgi:hypothetical protein
MMTGSKRETKSSYDLKYKKKKFTHASVWKPIKLLAHFAIRVSVMVLFLVAQGKLFRVYFSDLSVRHALAYARVYFI